jgi:hypothetical protein
MSNLFKKQRHFQVSQAILVPEILRGLPGSAVKLYVLLCGLAQRFTRPELGLRNDVLRLTTGLNDKTLKKAREQLVSHQLINVRRDAASYLTYVIMDPYTGDPLLAEEGRGGFRLVSVQDLKATASGSVRNRKKISAEKADATTVADQHRELERDIEQGQINRSDVLQPCYVHGPKVPHWKDGARLVCDRCHPRSAPLTAKQLFGT